MTSFSNSQSNQLVPLLGVALHVSHDCNLRCIYCYGQGSSYGGERMLMNKNNALNAIDFLINESGNREKCFVIFFGGEPILNMDIVRFVINYGRKKARKRGKQINFTMSTNGTLLNEKIIKYLNDNKIGVQISIDGPRKIQDINRPFTSGKGSYNFLESKIKSFIQSRKGNVRARAKITTNSIHFKKSLIHLLDLGFKGTTFSPAYGIDQSYAITMKNISVLKRECERVATYFMKQISAKRYVGFSAFLKMMERLHLGKPRMYGCGAFTNYVAISPEGDIYPCHRFVGMKDYYMGNILAAFDRTLQRRYLENSVDSRIKCKKCWARYFCGGGGGCAYEAVNINGEFERAAKVSCEFFRNLLELSLFIYSQIHMKDKIMLRELFKTIKEPPIDEIINEKKRTS